MVLVASVRRFMELRICSSFRFSTTVRGAASVLVRSNRVENTMDFMMIEDWLVDWLKEM